MKKALVLLSILLVSPALAEEIPVNIKADLLRYVEGSSVVTASGSVEVRLKEVVILADTLLMDTETNIVTAEGNVRIKGKEYEADCAALIYSAGDETSSYTDFRTVLLPENAKGEVFLQSETLGDGENRWEGSEGKVTTCDKDEPHYFTAAKRVVYYPEDKIEGFSTTFYVLDVPVLWTPYMYYDLKRRRKRNWSFGHNEVEGNFIKTSWDHPNGQILLDQMEKKGFGKGFTYDYSFGRQSGDLYAYHIEEADTHLTDWVTRVNHNIGITDRSKLGLSYSSATIYQVPAGRLDQSTYGISFSHTGKNVLQARMNALDNKMGKQERVDLSVTNTSGPFSSAYSFNLDQGKGDGRYIRSAQRLSHRQPLLTDRTALNLNMNYTNNIDSAGNPGNELLTPNVEVTHREEQYSVRYYQNWHLDLDRDLYSGDETDQFLEAQPDITVSFKPYDMRIFDLTPSFGYAWFREVKYVPDIGKNRDFATSRYRMTLNAGKTVPLAFGNTFSYGLGLDQFLYEPGDAMNAFREDLKLTTQGYDHVRNEIIYARGISDGNSPFYFDKSLTRYHNIRDNLRFYHADKFAWNNTCGYNFETNKYFNYETNMTIRPAKQVGLAFRSGFDIENQKYLDLSSGMTFNPWERFSTEINLVNDMNHGGLKQGNCLIDLETADEEDWGNRWRFRYGYVYEPQTQQFRLRDIMIIKDLHCWEAKYTYSDYRKEFTLTFTLKAFPDDPIGYTTGRGFYFDTFEKALKEEAGQSDAVRRY